MKASAVAFIFVIAALSCASLMAAEKPVENQRLCKQEDLIGGTWKLMQLYETPALKEATWYKEIPYHYLAFYPDQYYGTVASANEIKTPAELQKAMLWAVKGRHALRYTLDDKGILNLYTDKKMNYSYRCLTIIATQGGFKKGDLVLTGYTSKSKSELYKLYRRWY